jgi:hypothetical protein
MRKLNPYQIFMLSSSFISLVVMIAWICIGIPNVTNTAKDINVYNSYVGEIKFFDPGNKIPKADFDINEKIIYRADKKSRGTANLDIIDTITHIPEQEVLLQSESKYIIDTEKRSYFDQSGEKRVLFPPNTQNSDYSDVFYKVYPNLTISKFTFANEENVFGMFSYVFRYNLKDFPADQKMLVSPNEKLGGEKILGNFEGKIWVEPRTGFIIKQESYWDFSFKDGDGKKQTIESGRTWQQDEETKRVINIIESKKAMAQIYEMWIPIYLILFALAFIIGALVKNTSSK